MGRLAVAVIVGSWVIPISIIVNRIVPDPYMDEIFHVPQAQNYCKGNFKSWDPMITTPPGLYFLSLAHVASFFPGMFCIQAVSSYFDACSTAVLRSTNGVLAVICSILVYEIIAHLRPALDERKATLHAVVLALYPLHWFFTFLYYTDVASLTAVLATYLTCLKKNYPISALFHMSGHTSSNLKKWITPKILTLASILLITEGMFLVYPSSISVVLQQGSQTSLPNWHRWYRVVALYLIRLLMHYLNWRFYSICLFKRKPVLGALAVLIRQTNIVWVLFVACAGVIDCTLPVQKDKEQSDYSNVSNLEDDHIASNKGVAMWSNLKRRRFDNAVDSINHSIPRSSPYSPHSSGLVNDIKEILLRSWYIKWELLISFSPYLILLVAFVGFVRWNGSIVLGAKEAHAISPHFAQLMYFSLVSVLFMAPVHLSLSRAAVLFQSFCKYRLLSFAQWFIAFTAGFLSVHFCSIAHPYLLADNRHYPFYLWRKIIKAHWSMKYLMVPLYVFSWFSISNILAKFRKKIWVLVYFLACAAVLIPAPLIEFRYYTIPFFFLILHSHVNNDRSWILMGILYVVINIFTIYMFLFKPFYWNHEVGIQRFIW